jgi:hypothetical protein
LPEAGHQKAFHAPNSAMIAANSAWRQAARASSA